jgi:biopolymer transport protein ExbB
MGILNEETLPHDLTPWGMFLNADLVVQAIMIGLVLASVITWTVLLAKGIELMGARRRTHRALAILAAAGSLHDAVELPAPQVTALVHAALEELDASSGLPIAGIKERIASRLERIEDATRRKALRGLGILATIGATSPFVGLFGTVWGIMNSFIGISRSQTTNLAVVAPGIAEALLATAMGLIAAIPAVVIYNHFARSTAGYRAQLADASAEIRRLASRDLDRSHPHLRIAAQ